MAEKGKKGLISNIEKGSKGKQEFIPPRPPIPGRIHAHTLALGIGQTFLYGDLGKHGENAITPDFYYAFSASHSFDLLLNFHYSSHKVSDQTRAEIKGIALGIKGKFWQFDAFAPYLTGGLGFYAPRVQRPVEGTPTYSQEKVVLGPHLGLGADLQLNNQMTIGILLHLHNPFDSNSGNSEYAEGFYGKLLVIAGRTF